MIRVRTVSSAVVFTLGLTGTASSQRGAHQIVPLGKIPSEQWVEKVSGDPDKPGMPFVLRIHNDAGFVCAPHTHPTDEHIVVVQGTWSVGMGSRINSSTLQSLELGAYGLVPAKMAHFCRSKTETIIQVHGIGPFSIDLVDSSYELTKTGVSLIAGSPSGQWSSSSTGCFNLRLGDRVRAGYDGTVVGAQCFPANRFTQYWIQKANGERFWATLEELKKF